MRTPPRLSWIILALSLSGCSAAAPSSNGSQVAQVPDNTSAHASAAQTVSDAIGQRLDQMVHVSSPSSHP